MRVASSAALLALSVLMGSWGPAWASAEQAKRTEVAPPSAATESTSRPGFATPEDVVRVYLEGVASADMDRILDTSAAAEMSRGLRLDLLVDRLKAFTPHVPGPVHEPFFADMQRVGWHAQILGQARYLVFSLLAPDLLGDIIAGRVIADVDAAWAGEVEARLDPERLSYLLVVDVRLPRPDLYREARTIELNARWASEHGADERTDRVALFTFEGASYAVSFSLLRYGEDWLVMSQYSPFSDLPPSGAAQPMTADEFEELTTEP